MALQAFYKQFLAAPDSSYLAADATLHYVTTTTSFRGPADILKHVNTLQKQVKKKKEEFLSVIEGQNAAAIEVDTTLEFVSSGGAYLPGLDDNFLSDRTAYLPVIHIVTLNAEGKISQIRQSWDQGALLKQLDVIGKTGRNWPIRDGTEQIRLIANCLKNTAVENSADLPTRTRGNSTNAMRDPHTTLDLFGSREEAEQQQLASVISPRGGARPRQRDFAEILGDEPVDDSGSPSAGRARSQSPTKVIAPKAGAAKNFRGNRLFDTEEGLEEPSSPPNDKSSNRAYRPNPTKYNHFDLADVPETREPSEAGGLKPQNTKHSSQWSFHDFDTPHKAISTRVLQKNHQDVRHWGNEDDQVPETPVRRPAANKPRRDAETHFELVDDGLPQGEPRVSRPRGAASNAGQGLYKNNVHSEEGNDEAPAPGGLALGNITNLKDRGKTFDAQFAMTDDGPAEAPVPPRVSEDRKKVVKMMEPSWSTYDVSPALKENQPSKPPTSTEHTKSAGIHIGGDGMGGPKGTNRNWMFGEDDDVAQPAKSVPGKKQGANAQTGGFNWDF